MFFWPRGDVLLLLMKHHLNVMKQKPKVLRSSDNHKLEIRWNLKCLPPWILQVPPTICSHLHWQLRLAGITGASALLQPFFWSLAIMLRWQKKGTLCPVKPKDEGQRQSACLSRMLSDSKPRMLVCDFFFFLSSLLWAVQSMTFNSYRKVC